jgi:hypothetical protein
MPLYNIFKIWKGKNGAKVKSEIISGTIVVLMAFGIIIFDMLPVYGYSFIHYFINDTHLCACDAYIFIKKKPLSSIATNDILVIAILTSYHLSYISQ